MAVSFYADFKKAPAETAKSILISAAVRFAAFNLPEVADLTHTDNIHLDTLGDRKTALFIIILLRRYVQLSGSNDVHAAF